MEGVNNFAVNQASIHTAPGCTLPSNQLASTSQLTEGWFVNTDCASAHTNNEVRLSPDSECDPRPKAHRLPSSRCS
jgi:hypothetical protein